MKLIIIIAFLSSINSPYDIFFYLSNITKQVRENCRFKGEKGIRRFSVCDLQINIFLNNYLLFKNKLNFIKNKIKYK